MTFSKSFFVPETFEGDFNGSLPKIVFCVACLPIRIKTIKVANKKIALEAIEVF